MAKTKEKEKVSELEIRALIKKRFFDSLILWGVVGLILGLILVLNIQRLTFLKGFLWLFGAIFVSEVFIGLPWWIIDSKVIEKWELRGYNVKIMKRVSCISFFFVPFWLLIALVFLWYDKTAEHEYFKKIAEDKSNTR
ncbi:hypothetical protein IJH66_00535 [Candidatus Saccharibacteria bacterium]|nr:hypothetical protein [Candidatus Saccharibacteria bacterium]